MLGGFRAVLGHDQVVQAALGELPARTSSFELDDEVVRPAWPRLGVARLPVRFS